MEQSTLDYLDKFIVPGSLVLEIGDDGGGYAVELSRRATTGGTVVVFAASEGVAKDVALAMQYRDVGDERPNAEVLLCDILLSEAKKLDDLALPDLHFVKIGPMYDPYMIINGMKSHLVRHRPIILFPTPRSQNPATHGAIEDLLKALGYKLYVLNDGGLLEIGYPNFPRKETLAVYAGS